MQSEREQTFSNKITAMIWTLHPETVQLEVFPEVLYTQKKASHSAILKIDGIKPIKRTTGVITISCIFLPSPSPYVACVFKIMRKLNWSDSAYENGLAGEPVNNVWLTGEGCLAITPVVRLMGLIPSSFNTALNYCLE